MRHSPRITPIRLLAFRPVRLGRHRHISADALRVGDELATRHLALADASRPAWLNAPLFSRHQSPLSAVVRHAA